MQPVHVMRVQETVFDSPASQTTASWKPKSSPIKSTATPATASGKRTQREQRYIDASLHFSQMIQSPAAAANSSSTAVAAGGLVAPASATPTALPLSLLPFHRAFQSEGWRLAIATPEDRYTGRHLCTSLYALLWLKGPSSVLNYSSETHWIQKVRHMVAVRAAASLSGPRAVSQDALARPSLSEEAEFSLAHALHLPHTIIYSADTSEKPEAEKMQLSSFPAHIWQRAHPAVDCDAGTGGTGDLSQFPSVPIHPSVWYFSRHAFEGQNEILRKNKPVNKQEHLAMLRSTFLGGQAQAKAAQKQKATRPESAAVLKSSSSKSRPTSAASKWHEVSPASLSSDPRLAAVAHSPSLSPARANIVAQYTSLDRERGTHVSYLTREDLEAFLQNETAAADATAPTTAAATPGSRASSAARSRPSTAGSSSVPAAADTRLSDQARKDRLRQSLYTSIYNEMDVMATPQQATAGPGSQPIVTAVGTRPRPFSAAKPGATPDPLALHPHSVPTPAQFRGRRLVAMLQQFVHPPGEHAELLRVEWREEAVASWESRAATIARRKAAQQARAQRRRERRVQHSILDDRDPAAEEEADRLEAEAEQREAEAEAAQIAEDEAAEEARGGVPERRTVCYISRRLNANPLRALPNSTASARSPSLYERACCFSYSDAAPPVIDSTVMNGVLYTRLSYVCDIVAQHIRSVSGSNLSPHSMSIFFQIDADHNLHLLWCDRLIYWHEKALLDGPGKEVEQREMEAKLARKDERRRKKVEEALAKHARALRAEDPPISTPRLVASLPDEYDASFFRSLPKPSPLCAVISEVLQGRYHKMPQASAHMSVSHSLQDEQEEAAPSFVAPSDAPSVAPSQVASLEASATASAEASPRDVSLMPQRSVSYARVTFPDSDAEDADEDDDEEDVGARTGRLKVTDTPSVVTIQLGSGNAEDNQEKEEESKTQPPASASDDHSSAPMPASLDSDDDDDDASNAGGAASASDDPPDGLTALLQAKSDAALVEYQSGWADEILFEFARKRQQERNLFRQQEEAAFEAQTQKARNLFGSTVPVPGPAVGTPGTLGSPTAKSLKPPTTQGVNLLEAGAQVNTTMLRSRNRDGVTSSGAFLLAKAQRYASNTLGTAAPLGSKAFRAQLAMNGGLDLAPSGVRSDWEGRGTPIGLRHGLHDMSGVGSTPGSRPIDIFRMKQVAAMAPPSERAQQQQQQQAAEQSTHDAASRVSSDHKDEFSRRVFAELDAKGSEIRPLTTSASLSALGASMHNANAQLGRSSSSTSFAPPQRTDLQPQPSDSDEQAEEDGETDGTFMTSTKLSPRSLANKARATAPLGVGATRITLAAGDPTGIARALPASGGGYFVCPKCRLGLQIHAVHSTLVLDVIAEYERMVRFMSTHNRAFAEEIHLNFHRKRKGQTVPPQALHPYTDLSFYTEDSIPPALAFVFPSLTLAQYRSFKEDQGFLRSTIDLCEDCHLLVRVPVRPGGAGEEQHILEPLDLLHDEPRVVAPVIDHEGSAFDHPGAEYTAPGVSHGSTVARQKRREMDEATESEQFARDERALAAQRAERHANGELDLAAAGRVVPFEIRRLNQSTMDLLAHIPYNSIEVAEFERKRALEAEALDPHSTAKSEAVAAILNKYRAPKQLGVAAVDRDGSTLSHKRRAIQKDLLIQVGVVPEPWEAPPRPIHAAAPTFVANPFMKPRPASAASPARPAQHRATSAWSSPAAAVAGAHANRGEISAAQRSARFEAQVAAGPRAAMSRYDPNLPSSLGGVQVVPAHDAALVQSEWRRDTTEAVVNAIISRSEAERQRDIDVESMRGHLHAPLHSSPPPSTFQQRFSHRQSAAASSAFSALYSQITRPKPLGHPVDHVAVQLEAKARERNLRERPAWAVKAETKRIGVAPSGIAIRTDGNVATHVARPASARNASSPTRTSPLKVQITPAVPAVPASTAQITQLAMPYAVASPSPYLPHLSTVASNSGNMTANAVSCQPVM